MFVTERIHEDVLPTLLYFPLILERVFTPILQLAADFLGLVFRIRLELRLQLQENSGIWLPAATLHSYPCILGEHGGSPTKRRCEKSGSCKRSKLHKGT